MAKRHYFKCATLNGDGVTIDATGNYTSLTRFALLPPTDEELLVERAIITMAAGTINDSSKYGDIIGGVTGVELKTRDGSGEVLDFTPFPIQTNGDWAACCYDFNIIAGFGAGDDHAVIRWTFTKGGGPISLSQSRGQGLYLELEGDFTSLSKHRFFFQCVYDSDKYWY